MFRAGDPLTSVSAVRSPPARVLACAAPRTPRLRPCLRIDAPGREWRCRTDVPLMEKHLARDDLIEATGSVDKILGGGRYQITLESGQVVTAQLSGRMRRFRIRVIPGDRVTVGLSPYDPTHGFITFRLREGQ